MKMKIDRDNPYVMNRINGLSGVRIINVTCSCGVRYSCLPKYSDGPLSSVNKATRAFQDTFITGSTVVGPIGSDMSADLTPPLRGFPADRWM
jgi:hypothetical protein